MKETRLFFPVDRSIHVFFTSFAKNRPLSRPFGEIEGDFFHVLTGSGEMGLRLDRRVPAIPRVPKTVELFGIAKAPFDGLAA